LLDLSVVTDLLIKKLQACRDASPIWNPTNLAVSPGPSFTITISGSAPETVRDASDCELSLYLFHVAADKFQRNLQPLVPVPSGSAPVPFQPLSLDLYYLLTAYAKGDYVHEQQAMSIALRCFHENPIQKTTVLVGGKNVQNEFSLTLEVETSEELGRFWQATTVPLRLAAVYKVSVVLISPEAADAKPAPPTRQVSIAVDPTSLPNASTGQIVGTFRTVQYHSPDSTVAQPDIRSFDLSPATVAPGQNFFVFGAGLNQPTSKRVYLLMPPDFRVEHEITGWLTTPKPPQTDTRYTLQLPNSVGAPPANAPAAGIYQLRVGSDLAQGDRQTVRSNATPFSIAARVDAFDPPLLTGGGPFTINGIGLVAGSSQVLLGTVPLTETGGAPGAGQFQVKGGGTSFALMPPATLAAGRYGVRVRVNQVEAAPAWWLQI